MDKNKIEPDERVLKFIDRVLDNYPAECKPCAVHGSEVIRYLFHAGYCWYFAHMLSLAFPELDGHVCLAAPFGHFVWVADSVPYDIEGVYYGEADCFIPEELIGDGIQGFMHVDGKDYGTTAEERDKIITDYINDLPNRPEWERRVNWYLLGYENANRAIDSFCMDGCFDDAKSFAASAKANIRILYTEEQVAAMDEARLYSICVKIKESLLSKGTFWDGK